MDDQKEMVSITVLIAGRPYPLKINKADEPSIRTIVKEINTRVNNFQLKYTTKDKQDCLSMAALTYAVELAKARKNKLTNTTAAPPSTNISDQSGLLEMLSEIDSLLDLAIRKA